jgi:hypothetical protein
MRGSDDQLLFVCTNALEIQIGAVVLSAASAGTRGTCHACDADAGIPVGWVVDWTEKMSLFTTEKEKNDRIGLLH